MWVPGGWGSQVSRTSTHQNCNVVSPKHRPHLRPRKYWYSFPLVAESTPGPQRGRKDYVNEKSLWHHRESRSRLSATFSTNCATVCPSVDNRWVKYQYGGLVVSVRCGKQDWSKPWPTANWSTTNPTYSGLGSNQGIRCEMPMTNCLSRGMAFSTIFQHNITT
jgi:hypothetical protein